jgi:two-component system CheB/CheR fusion protein
VFEPFMQVDRGASSRAGLGIGLTLVQRIVALHGGQVEAKSAGLGKGSEFVVLLPKGDADTAAQTQAQAQAQAEAAAIAHAKAHRVLVVDDNGDSRDSVAELVRSWGHATRTASDGASALAATREFKPGVVLLDIGLPDIDGFELARRLRALPGSERAFIVAMTGYGTERDRRASRDAGIDEHMTKPIDLNTLQLILARLPDAPG